MEKGEWVNTPRFCKVEIEEIYETETEARKAGYTVNTYRPANDGYKVVGKQLDMYHMIFAAARV